MKKSAQTPIIQLTEKFDRQLLNMLSEELKSLKKAKNNLLQTFKPRTDDGLLVA